MKSLSIYHLFNIKTSKFLTQKLLLYYFYLNVHVNTFIVSVL